MQMKMTPKRRRKFLDPKNLSAWSDAFIRRVSGAAPVALEVIVERYLVDTKASLLREEPNSMESLRRGMAEAMLKTWDIIIGEDGMSQGTQLLEFGHLGGKVCLTIPSMTILNIGSGFNEKDMTTRGSITGGTACPYSCVYCSTPTMMGRSHHTRILRLLGIKHADAVIRRLDPVNTLRAQLTHKDGSPRFKDDHGVVIISPIVDPLPNIEIFEESLELILLVMELTGWDVRVLTKSWLVRKLAERIPAKYRRRLIYGVSLGIIDDNIAKVVERGASPPLV